MTQTIPFFDGHNDFLLRLMMNADRREDLWLGDTGEGHLDLSRMRRGGFAGGMFAIFVPPKSSGPPPDFMALTADPPYEIPLPPLMRHDQAQPVALQMAGMMHWMARTAPNEFALCRSAGDVRRAMTHGAIAGIMHMEGAEAIDPDLDALYLFHDMGLRSLGPVWSRPTIFGEGVPMSFPGTPDIGGGLTERGRALVQLCNRLGILIDLSHLNEKGFDDVARLSDAPMVATHSNTFAHSQSPRNLTDRQLAQIRETGGIVGLNYATSYLRADGRSFPDIGWDDLLRHMDHLITQLGEDHVGLGSDFDGCVVPDGIGDVTGVQCLFDVLSRHGYDDALLARIARDNWLNCLDRTFKA
jgi:membrane dipeptidase